MIRTYNEVPKRAKNSITIQLEKLIKKYGEKAVRLVSMKNFEKKLKERRLQEEIAKKENELQDLKRSGK